MLILAYSGPPCRFKSFFPSQQNYTYHIPLHFHIYRISLQDIYQISGFGRDWGSAAEQAKRYLSHLPRAVQLSIFTIYSTYTTGGLSYDDLLHNKILVSCLKPTEEEDEDKKNKEKNKNKKIRRWSERHYIYYERKQHSMLCSFPGSDR